MPYLYINTRPAAAMMRPLERHTISGSPLQRDQLCSNYAITKCVASPYTACQSSVFMAVLQIRGAYFRQVQRSRYIFHAAKTYTSWGCTSWGWGSWGPWESSVGDGLASICWVRCTTTKPQTVAPAHAHASPITAKSRKKLMNTRTSMMTPA